MTTSCAHCCTKIEGLGVNFGKFKALEKVDIHLNCGELVAIIGPNGAGKTTLLRAILNEIPFSGNIRFQFKGIRSSHPKIGYVPQKLFIDSDSPLSVLDFLTIGLSGKAVWWGVDKPLKKQISQALELVAGEHLLKKRMSELSGGELQRVLLAMAMTPPPGLLLLDEPVSGVDAKGLVLFYSIVSDLRKTHDVSVLMATHDLAGVSQWADRVVLLNHSVIAQGSPKSIMADERLIQAFGPGLLNVSALPHVHGKQEREELND